STDFRFDNPRLAQAYEESWLACRLIADLAGSDGLVRLYREVGASRAASRPALEHAVRDVLKMSLADFVDRWRSTLVAELSGPPRLCCPLRRPRPGSRHDRPVPVAPSRPPDPSGPSGAGRLGDRRDPDSLDGSGGADDLRGVGDHGGPGGFGAAGDHAGPG